MSLSGTVIRKPIVRDKVIFSTIESDGEEYQIVCFPKYRPQEVVDTVSALDVGDEINLIGRLEINDYTNRQQFVVDAVEKKPNQSDDEWPKYDKSDKDWTYNAKGTERWLEDGDPKLYSLEKYNSELDCWIPECF